jgi:GNAT superfamily N-acetyltransferase
MTTAGPCWQVREMQLVGPGDRHHGAVPRCRATLRFRSENVAAPRAQRPVSTGARLVDECLRFAERSGYTRIVLWTNDVLGAARRIYTRAGFQLDRQEPHHSFGHDLIGEYWSREL